MQNCSKKIMGACALIFLSSCASFRTQSTERAPIPASLMVKCQPLNKPESGIGADMLRWSIETIRLYKDCADGKAALIDAVI